tara:strand:- start:5089 stop:6135 length:1047 start_codon:yes stop_codon:yes gene_type:complete
MVYFVSYFLLLFATYIGRHGAEVQKILYYFFLFFLFCFSGFRYEVGCDWKVYNVIFDYDSAVYAFRDGGSLEIGYYLTMIWLKKFGLGFQALNIITSGLFFLGLHAIAKREKYPLLILALAFPFLIINLPMSGIRQGAAFGLLAFAFLSFIDRRFLRFLFFTLLATSFHSSAILFFLLAPMYFFKFNLRNSIIAAALISPILISIYLSSFGLIAQERYIQGDLSSFGAYFRISIIFLIALYFLFFMRKKWVELFPKDYEFILMGAIGIVLTTLIILPISTVIADRLGFYLWFFVLIILGRAISIPSRLRELSVIGSILGLFFAFTFWTQNSPYFYQCYVPYNFQFTIY